jgi:hypothetical protein
LFGKKMTIVWLSLIMVLSVVSLKSGAEVTGVTFYQDANYGGKAVTLGPGNYNLSQLNAAGIPNDWMSSLKVPVGYTVEVYQHYNFTGLKWTYTADLSYVGSSCNDQMSSVKITLAATAVSNVMFDDFNYNSSGDSVLSNHGWSVRTGSGGPGISGCTWSSQNVTFLTDPNNSANKLMRLSATANNSKPSQAEVYTKKQKYFAGTYAALVRFTDSPISGPDGDQVVETFFTISTLNYNNDSTYSELDFEYLANGGWDVSGPTMWMTSWYTYTPNPWSQDSLSNNSRMSYNGWHTLVLVVANGEMKYYIDGALKATHTGKYYPRKKMSINFNLWFIAEGILSSTASRTYVEDVDWVYHAKDTVLTPDQVNAQVKSYRDKKITFTDTVN